MNSAHLINLPHSVSGPPPGAVNVSAGKPVEGPGGRWIPCATAISGGLYIAGLFQVGSGHKQVCVTSRPTHHVNEALSLAVLLAETAAA